MKARILVVDDEAAVRAVLQRFFAKKGYVVSSAADGVEALELVGKERPQLMILDIRMPRMDGLEVLRRVRKTDPSIAVMMITANTDEELARQTLKMGAFDYVTKPFDLEYLENAVMAKLALMAP